MAFRRDGDDAEPVGGLEQRGHHRRHQGEVAQVVDAHRLLEAVGCGEPLRDRHHAGVGDQHVGRLARHRHLVPGREAADRLEAREVEQGTLHLSAGRRSLDIGHGLVYLGLCARGQHDPGAGFRQPLRALQAEARVRAGDQYRLTGEGGGRWLVDTRRRICFAWASSPKASSRRGGQECAPGTVRRPLSNQIERSTHALTTPRHGCPVQQLLPPRPLHRTAGGAPCRPCRPRCRHPAREALAG
mmetsp:Transcript_80372/g.227645  ORF Transcript_80372/g.227645 Transcript_80372/m.227645 type:complete len:243 (-) Transcript_80372:273-1001(-)